MAVERTELVSIVNYYWERHWMRNPKLTLVLCGSIISYMVEHVLHSEVLHNRKTFEMKIEPLPAHESKKFFGNYRSDFEISKFLMIFGGIPKYLEEVRPRQPLSDNMDRLCFQKDGFFVNEFETVFKEQFKVVRNYEEIVKALVEKGATTEQLVESLHKKGRGELDLYLEKLERAGFIKKFTPHSIGLKRGKRRLDTLFGTNGSDFISGMFPTTFK